VFVVLGRVERDLACDDEDRGLGAEPRREPEVADAAGRSVAKKRFEASGSGCPVRS
jgi:hypothetical protein